MLPESVKAYSFNLNDYHRWSVSFIVLCVFNKTLRSPFVLSVFFPFLLESVTKAMMLNLSLFSPFYESGFYVFKASRSQGRAKVSLGSVFICESSDREARKLSQAREEGKRQCCVRLRSDCSRAAAFGFPNKNITLRKK